MKKLLFIGLLLQVCFEVNSQNLPEITPPSPTAYSLTKYGDIPINESTGIANVSIPIAVFKTRNLALPISLDYSASGIKVDQVASWVGLGWDLSAGGVITRTIRGQADEKNGVNFVALSTVLNYALSPFVDFVKNVTDDGNDYQPDIFSFNFNGYSGRFYLDSNSNPVLIKRDNKLKIEKIGSGLSVLDGYKITTPDGVTYFFGQDNAIEFSQNESLTVPSHLIIPDMDRPTSWYLTKIKHPKGDEILLEYNYTASYYYISGFSQEFVAHDNITGNNGNCQLPQNGYINTAYKTNIQTVKLSKISTNTGNEQIVFNATKSRADLSNEYRLNSIVVKNGSQVIHGYNLNYDTVTSSVSYNGATNFPWLTSTENKKRMFLDTVEQTDSNGGTTNGKKYVFYYEDKTGLPPRLSFSQDYLGFYNGVSNAGYLPENVNLLNYFNGITRGDRSANFSYAKKGILTKIKYPTGGFTELEYEPAIELVTTTSQNDVFSSFGMTVDNTNFQDIHTQNLNNLYNQTIQLSPDLTILNGGMDYTHDIAVITVKNLSTNAVILNETINHSFNGSFNVALNAGINYEIKVSFQYVKFDEVSTSVSFSYKSGESTSSQTSSADRSGIRIKKTISKASPSSQSIIKKYFYAKRDNLSVETLNKLGAFNFITSDYGDRSVCPEYTRGNITIQQSFLASNRHILKSTSFNHFYLTAPLYTMYSTVTTSLGDNFEGGGIEKEFNISGYVSGGYKVFGNGIDDFSAKKELHVDNGNLKKEIHFIKNGSTIQDVLKKEYFYKIDESKTSIIDAYAGRIRSTPLFYTSGTYSEIEGRDVQNYKIYSKWISLDSTATTNYHSNGNFITGVKYKYDSGYEGLPSEIISTNSSGDLLKTKNYYATLQAIIDKNGIGEVVKTQSYKNSTLLSTQNTTYKSSDSLPDKIQTSKGSGTLEDRIVFHSYDNKGNPTEVSKVNGTHIVYIWGYNQTQPIAKIENATLSDIPTAVYNSIVSASNSDTSVSTENTLRTELEKLRNSSTCPNLTNAQITTYTYDPLIGVTSVTDPRGRAQYYFYDSFNRLQYVKDHDGNILTENQYNYKN